MATFLYQWAEGVISVCSAKNRDEAADLFDEIGDIQLNRIIKLKSPILFTTRAKVEGPWELYPESIGEEIYGDILEKCYPNYYNDNGKDEEETAKALKKDEDQATRELKGSYPSLDLVVLFPRGLPGQNN